LCTTKFTFMDEKSDSAEEPIVDSMANSATFL